MTAKMYSHLHPRHSAFRAASSRSRVRDVLQRILSSDSLPETFLIYEICRGLIPTWVFLSPPLPPPGSRNSSPLVTCLSFFFGVVAGHTACSSFF